MPLLRGDSLVGWGIEPPSAHFCFFRAVRDFWGLRLRMWAAPRRALERGRAILG